MLLYFAIVGDADAREKIALLYEKHKKKMFYVAYGILNDSFAAEDAVHEAFISVSRNIGKIDEVDSEKTIAYLCRAAKTRALNILEAKTRELEHGIHIEEDDDIAFEEAGFERIIAKSELSVIADCINRLPEKYRIVIILRYLDEMKPSKIAKELGIKNDAVKKRLLRGKALLKNMLEEARDEGQ